MIPVYPASARFSSWQIGRSVKTVLETVDAGEDPLRPSSGNARGSTTAPWPCGPSTDRWIRPT